MSGVINVVQVIHNELNLVLVGNGSGESLELQFLNLLGFAVTDTLNDGIKILCILSYIDRLSERIIMPNHLLLLLVLLRVPKCYSRSKVVKFEWLMLKITYVGSPN